MPGTGRCRDCHNILYWGQHPNGTGTPFPFDDPTHIQPHFASCAAIPRITDPWTGDEVRVSRCGFCRASIWWQDTARHKHRPMNIQPDGRASQQCHLDTCSGSPRRAPWTGQDWTEPDPNFRVSGAPSAAEAKVRAELTGHLRVLGLAWPCSKDDINRAYRRLARSRHPDAGGSSDAFIQVKSAADSATALLERMPSDGDLPMP